MKRKSRKKGWVARNWEKLIIPLILLAATGILVPTINNKLNPPVKADTLSPAKPTPAIIINGSDNNVNMGTNNGIMSTGK